MFTGNHSLLLVMCLSVLLPICWSAATNGTLNATKSSNSSDEFSPVIQSVLLKFNRTKATTSRPKVNVTRVDGHLIKKLNSTLTTKSNSSKVVKRSADNSTTSQSNQTTGKVNMTQLLEAGIRTTSLKLSFGKANSTSANVTAKNISATSDEKVKRDVELNVTSVESKNSSRANETAERTRRATVNATVDESTEVKNSSSSNDTSARPERATRLSNMTQSASTFVKSIPTFIVNATSNVTSWAKKLIGRDNASEETADRKRRAADNSSETKSSVDHSANLNGTSLDNSTVVVKRSAEDNATLVQDDSVSRNSSLKNVTNVIVERDLAALDNSTTLINSTRDSIANETVIVKREAEDNATVDQEDSSSRNASLKNVTNIIVERDLAALDNSTAQINATRASVANETVIVKREAANDTGVVSKATNVTSSDSAALNRTRRDVDDVSSRSNLGPRSYQIYSAPTTPAPVYAPVYQTPAPYAPEVPAYAPVYTTPAPYAPAAPAYVPAQYAPAPAPYVPEVPAYAPAQYGPPTPAPYAPAAPAYSAPAYAAPAYAAPAYAPAAPAYAPYEAPAAPPAYVQPVYQQAPASYAQQPVSESYYTAPAPVYSTPAPYIQPTAAPAYAAQPQYAPAPAPYAPAAAPYEQSQPLRPSPTRSPWM